MSEGVNNKRQIIEQLFNDHYQRLFYYAYDLTNDVEGSMDLVIEAVFFLV
jgi:DNA-directed RNA polymerase specialized sigma24 family protein